MSTDLDTRARAAAQALRDSVPFEPSPAPSAPAWRPHRGPRPLVLFGALAVLLVVAAAVWSQQGDDDQPSVVAGPSPADARLVPRVLPAGIELVGAADVASVEGPPIDAELEVYGREGSFDEVDLAVMRLRFSESPSALEGERLDVGGRPAVFSDDPFGGERILTVEVEPRLRVVALSRTLSDDDLKQVGDGLEVGTSGVEVGDLPEGLEPVAAISGTAPTLGPDVPIPVLPSGAQAVGGQGPDYEAHLQVTTLPGDERHLQAARWELGPDAENVEVREHDAVFASRGVEGDDDYLSLIWRESDELVVIVGGSGLSKAQLLDAAESLEPASEQEWAELLELTEEPQPEPGALAVIRGKFADGTAFAASVGDDGSLCLDLESSGQCTAVGPDDQPFGARPLVLDDDGHAVVVGRWPTTLRSAELRLVSGEELPVSTADVDDGSTFYAVALPPGPGRSGRLTLTDGEGERHEIAVGEGGGTTPTTVE